MIEEKTFISSFDIIQNGYINVRKTTQVIKDGKVISETYWRCALYPDDPQAEEVLNEPYYLNLARAAWTEEIINEYKAKQNGI